MSEVELYFNHAGTSWPKPQVVSEAVAAAMSTVPTEWSHRFDQAHHAIAEFFGVQQADQILLTPGCTSALATGIGDVLIRDGRRILTSHWEHHALHRPLLKLASKGVLVEHIPPNKDEFGQRLFGIDLDWLERTLSVGDVGLIAITAACNVTGELLPFVEVINLAHQYGTMVLIDAAQIVGWLDLDLPELGADLVAFGGHKGLQGPWGIGGLYVSERAEMMCATATCALPVAGASREAHNTRPSYCDVGSVDQVALAGLHAAIGLLRTQDLQANLSNARKQIQRLREMFQSIEGIQTLGTTADGLPTIALRFSGLASGSVASHLARHRISVGSGIHCAPLAHETLGTMTSGLVRFSVGVGQPDREVDEAIDRLQTVLDERSFHDLRDKS